MTEERGAEALVEARGNVAGTDAALIAAALADRHQFAHLYERYADRLYRYARARTGSTAVADDIVSDTMLAAMEGLAGFDAGKGTFAGWLFAIARHRIADRGRHRARFARLLERTRSTQAALGDDILDDTIRREDARLVRRMLSDLPERDRELVLLRYSAGLNSTEIADALGITSGAVRTRLSRTLRRMATSLSRHEDGENIT